MKNSRISSYIAYSKQIIINCIENTVHSKSKMNPFQKSVVVVLTAVCITGAFGIPLGDPKFLTQAFSLEAAVSNSYINKVEGIPNFTEGSSGYPSLYKNEALGMSAAGRYKFWHDYAVVAEYDQGIFMGTIGNQQLEPKPNMAVGLEKGTPTHTFQLFLSSYNGLIPQQNFIENQVDFRFISQMMLGFNITVRFY